MDISERFSRGIELALKQNAITTMETATVQELYNAMGCALNGICRDSFSENPGEKRACYFSAEFLIGKLIFSNISNLGLTETAEKFLNRHSRSLKELENIDDAALGNGGLGRLAACFLDSAASTDIPLDGFGIRYSYGIFKQIIEDGEQKEVADNWLSQGDPFGIRRDSEAVKVRFSDMEVLAVPYDYYIIGDGGACINRLRLYQAESEEPFDFADFNCHEYEKAYRNNLEAESISAVLYPNDNDERGKLLRIRQQYFFCSAALQNILSTTGADANTLPSLRVIQLNDTHPAVAISELIRLLMAEGCIFDDAFQCASRVFAYTNHTVMAEALESWDYELYTKLLPEIVAVIELIDKRLCGELTGMGVSEEKLEDYRIVSAGRIHMARLAVYCSFSVNGVARIHTQILKNDVLRCWHELYPQKFSNKTNGITQRRWLKIANPELYNFISELLGEDFISKPESFSELNRFRGDRSVLQKLNEIKKNNKQRLCYYLEKKQGTVLNPSFIFSTQVKRIHEYKRQLMNALSIADIYLSLKSGELSDLPPVAFIIGGKAAPGYRLAKGIIRYITALSELINSDEAVSERIRVVFAENYNVSSAEMIIPAADLSEQISLAGTEASGTGNMKLMMNGALTLGTFDGANIEIVQQAGEQNNYIFGLRENQVRELFEAYEPKEIYATDKRVKRAVDTLIDGTVSDGDTGVFKEIYNSLLKSNQWQRADRYFVLSELNDYTDTRLKAFREYTDRISFAEKSLSNIAGSGVFSSDRTVGEYAREIWFRKDIG